MFPVLRLSFSHRLCSLLPRRPRSWTRLLTGLRWTNEDTRCSHQHKEALPSSILAAAALKRRAHAKTLLFGAKEQIHAQISRLLKLSWKCQRGWHFQNNSRIARISENLQWTSSYCLNISREVAVNGVSFFLFSAVIAKQSHDTANTSDITVQW